MCDRLLCLVGPSLPGDRLADGQPCATSSLNDRFNLTHLVADLPSQQCLSRYNKPHLNWGQLQDKEVD